MDANEVYALRDKANRLHQELTCERSESVRIAIAVELRRIERRIAEAKYHA